MIDTLHYATFKPRAASYYGLMLACILAIGLGGYCAMQMDHHGHFITGMNNQVVWGLPHVYAVSLIVCASGVLNGATLGSVFGLTGYKPVSRLSVVLAMSILLGGLAVLVVDLGRPDRLIVAITHYNFRSIFTWNIFLYSGFLFVCVCYLWMMMEKRFNHHVSTLGLIALIWRIVLTAGTGSIFGLLIGQSVLQTLLLALLFIALSLVTGTAVLGLATVLLDRWQPMKLDEEWVASLNRVQLRFLAVLLILSMVYFLTNLYGNDNNHVGQFSVTGSFSFMFWIGHVVVGLVIPFGLILYQLVRQQNQQRPKKCSVAISQLVIGSLAVQVGTFALLYVVIVGWQSTPRILFPGKTVLASRFGDAGFPAYFPTLWEWGLGLGGVSVALFIFLLTIRIFPLVPESIKLPPVRNEKQ